MISLFEFHALFLTYVVIHLMAYLMHVTTTAFGRPFGRKRGPLTKTPRKPMHRICQPEQQLQSSQVDCFRDTVLSWR